MSWERDSDREENIDSQFLREGSHEKSTPAYESARAMIDSIVPADGFIHMDCGCVIDVTRHNQHRSCAEHPCCEQAYKLAGLNTICRYPNDTKKSQSSDYESARAMLHKLIPVADEQDAVSVVKEHYRILALMNWKTQA